MLEILWILVTSHTADIMYAETVPFKGLNPGGSERVIGQLVDSGKLADGLQEFFYLVLAAGMFLVPHKAAVTMQVPLGTNKEVENFTVKSSYWICS